MEAISDDGSPTLESRYFVQIQTVVQTIETFFFTGILRRKQSVILISLISASIDEQLIVIVGGGGVRIAFLEIFAINYAADSRLARSKQRNEKADDENAAKQPNGPIVTGAKEPRLEEIPV